MYLEIRNTGEIEPDAFILLGGTTKLNKSDQIGEYGSGNKYAVPWFLRNNVELKVFSGTTEIPITTVKKMFRDTEVEIVYINNEKTSITVNTGQKDWHAWSAFRELYSNAIDEGGAVLQKVDQFHPKAGETRIYIEYVPAVKEFYYNFNHYFAFKRMDILDKTDIAELYPKSAETGIVYRKGIRCYDNQQEMFYDYNFSDIEINESRETHEWDINNNISKFWRGNNNKEMVKEFLLKISDSRYDQTRESSFVDWDYPTYTDVWKENLKGYTIVPAEDRLFYDGAKNAIYLPAMMVMGLHKAFKDELEYPDGLFSHLSYKEMIMDEFQSEMLLDAMNEAKGLGFEINTTIKFVEVKNSLAIAGYLPKEQLIIVTKEAFYSFEVLLECLIHEQMHHESQSRDKTREFENFLIKRMIEVSRRNK